MVLNREAQEYFGTSPIVEAWLKWKAGVIGKDVALESATQDALVQVYRAEYLLQLSDRCVRWCYKGHWEESLVLHQILMAICLKAPDRYAKCFPRLVIEHLRVVTAALWHEANPSIYADAVGWGQLAWQGAASLSLKADIAREMGILHLDPYVAHKQRQELMHWWESANHGPDEGDDAATLPEPLAALGLAKLWLERALALRGDPGIERLELLKALLQAEYSAPTVGGEVDVQRAKRFMAQAIPLLPLADDRADILSYLKLVAAQLEQADEKLPAVAVGDLSDISQTDWEARIESQGIDLVAETLLAHLRAAAEDDRSAALAIVSHIGWVFEKHASEEMREKFHRRVIDVLIGDPVEVDKQEEAMGQELALLAQKPTHEAIFKVLDWVACRVQQEDESRAAELLVSLCKAAPDFYRRFAASIDLLRAFLALGVAVNRLREGRIDDAVAEYFEAQSLFLWRHFNSRAIEMIMRIASLMPEASPRTAYVICELVREQMPPWQPEAIHKNWQIACATLAAAATVPMENQPSLDGWFSMTRLAKGVDFANQLLAKVRYDWRQDPHTGALVAEIAQLQSSAADEKPRLESSALFEDILAASFSEASDSGGDSPGEQRDNLARRLDEQVRAQLALLGASAQQRFSVEEARARIPEDAVLIDLFFPSDAKSYGYGLALTREDEQLFGIRMKEQLFRGMSIDGDTSRNWSSHTGIAVAMTRASIRQAPSENRALTPEAAEHLKSASRLFLGNALEWLETQYEIGKRHLIIVPDGPTHFFPFHLLGLHGVPLADLWTVTYLPSMDLLRRPPPPHGDRDGAAVFGLSYRNASPKGRLPPLEGAAVEAGAVAEALGIEAADENRSTPENVQAALKSARYVHIACHGNLDVVASTLQCLHLHGGSLYNLDILGLDLRGLEVLGLSACETALGRVDIGGNLLGISASALAGGAGCVIGTLWRVADDASTVFFAVLFTLLAQGETRRDAFRRAQIETRKRFHEYRDWGAFYMSGDW